MKKLVSAWLLVTSLGMLSLSIAAVSGAAESSSTNANAESGPKDRPALRGAKALGPFSLFDTNHDGTISAEEIAGAAAALAKLDKNHDGKITANETRPPRPPREGEGEKDRGEGGDMPPPPPEF